MSYIIVDMDNCISNDGWRIERINWGEPCGIHRYFEYHSLAPFDQFGNSIIFEQQHDVIISTGRYAMFAAITEEWLKLHNIRPRAMFMRSNSDNRPGIAIKEANLFEMCKIFNISIGEIAGAYDDDPMVIEMYLRHGIAATHAKLHDIPYERTK